MRKIFLFIFCCLLISCLENNKSNNKKFENDYKKSMSTILKTQIGLNSDLNLQRHSILFLESASGQYTDGIGSWDIPVYINLNDCIKDLKKFRKWYNKNRDNITQNYIDSIYNVYYNSICDEIAVMKYNHSPGRTNFRKKSVKKEKRHK